MRCARTIKIAVQLLLSLLSVDIVHGTVSMVTARKHTIFRFAASAAVAAAASVATENTHSHRAALFHFTTPKRQTYVLPTNVNNNEIRNKYFHFSSTHIYL